MQTPSGVRGYSDFFTSGFRAVTTRSSHSIATSRSSLQPVTNAVFSNARERRSLPRPTSLVVPSTSTSASSKSNTRSKPRGLRSSIASFPSRLFERIISTATSESSFIASSRASRSSRVFDSWFSSDESVSEVLIKTGGPSAPNGSALHHTIDPFSSSSDSRSIFIGLSSDNSPTGTPKRESFLSLTGSSNRSSLIFTRRERPTSVQTMPLPSRSQRSSLQYRPPSQEKSDFFLILEEEPSLVDHDEWDAPAKIDWRQFHIDILTNDTQ